MLYVSHPCSDIMRTCLCDNFDGALMLKPQRTSIPNSKRYTMGSFEVRDTTTEDAEYSHEYTGKQQTMYNKLQVWAINKKAILRICPEYVHFNKSINNR